MFDIDKSDIKKLQLAVAESVVDKLTNFIDSLPEDYQGLQDTISIFEDDEEVSVVSNSEAFAQADHGMVPGAMPNIDKIRDWVRFKKDKTIDYAKFSKKGKELGLGGNVLYDSYIERITYAVAKKIQDEGIAPKHMIERVLTEEMGAERLTPRGF